MLREFLTVRLLMNCNRWMAILDCRLLEQVASVSFELWGVFRDTFAHGRSSAIRE
jgi:hypothetical protein